MALGALAKFAGVEFPVSEYKGKPSSMKVNPRNLPSDEVIAHWWQRMKDYSPEWGWVFGVMACYGLRPGEVWFLDPASLQQEPGILRVLDGKTGEREGILPLYPEWWQRWELAAIRLPANGAKDVGGVVSKHFKRAGVPFRPYDLRHAWAGRASWFGLDTGSAAYQMGHSVRMHQEFYGHWYNERHQRQVFSLLMSRSDRPVAPMGSQEIPRTWSASLPVEGRPDPALDPPLDIT
jgi:integrase